MKTVYEPANSADAHMIVHLLEQNDIYASIHGEALTGGIGGLPTSGLMQVLVAEEHYSAARKLILEWEETHSDSNDITTPYIAQKKSVFLLFLYFGGAGLAAYLGYSVLTMF